MEEVLNAPRGIPIGPRALKGQQWEKFLVVGFVAVDLAGGTGARRRTVEHGAPVVLEDAKQEQQPPAAVHPRRRARTHAEHIHVGPGTVPGEVSKEER